MYKYSDISDPVEVECDMESYSDQISTLIHHNTEPRIYVQVRSNNYFFGY